MPPLPPPALVPLTPEDLRLLVPGDPLLVIEGTRSLPGMRRNDIVTFVRVSTTGRFIDVARVDEHGDAIPSLGWCYFRFARLHHGQQPGSLTADLLALFTA